MLQVDRIAFIVRTVFFSSEGVDVNKGLVCLIFFFDRRICMIGGTGDVALFDPV